MATISSSTGYSVGASSKGISGLVSGLDTEEMVKKLLSGTQAKIDAQTAKKQQISWKQEAYRDVVASLRNFQLSYFSFTNTSSNLLSSAFYNTMAAASSNSAAVKVGATQDAAAGAITINKVSQLATSRKDKSAIAATAKLEGSVDITALKAAAGEGKNTLELTLDGVKKSFSLKTDGTAADLITQLNTDVQKAFGNGVSIKAVEGSEDTFTIDTDNHRQVIVSGGGEALSALGLKNGQSNKMNLNTTLGNLNFAAPLQGSEFEFTINGATIKADAQDTLRSLISKINASDAGVTVSYSSVDDTFSIESKTSGAGITFDMSQQKGNLLTALFGVGGSGSVSSDRLTVTETGTDGKPKTVTATAAATMEQLGLGSGSLRVGNQVVEFTKDTTLEELLNGTGEHIGLKDALAAAGQTGAEVSYNEETGVLSITGVSADDFSITTAGGDGGALLKKLFSADSLTFNTASTALKSVEEGKNAKFTVNNVEMEKNTNTFELDGLSIQLLQKTDAEVTITTTRDTDQIYKGIESFVEAYNALLDKLNGLVDEDTEYKNYPPLTTEQKAEMTESEIKLWEEKAKTGLLRNDGIISELLSEMRTALYQKPAGANFALYDIGISTGEWRQKGKLVIEDPERLRSIIESNSQEIYNLFNDKDSGLAVEMNKLIDGAAKVSSATPGSLVTLAGAKSMSSDTQNTLSKQMKDIDTIIENLKRTYETEKTRYWKQFNAMEQMIANMNQQSNWLMSQFS